MAAPLIRGEVFINYTHPNQKANAHIRRQIASYIGTHFRNRSKPATRTSAKNQNLAAKAKLADSGYEVLPQQSQNKRQFSPSPVRQSIGKGNSDPFEAYAVRIGPEENQLLEFYRDVFLPVQYRARIPRSVAAQLRLRDWEGCVAGLQDQGVAHALLARLGAMVARFTPTEPSESVLRHKHSSIHLLRIKLAEVGTLQMFEDYMQISHLYSAETISRNKSGSTIHGRMLLNMFQHAWRQGTLDSQVLMWQVHNDMQAAIIFVQRPLYDVNQWLPRIYAPLQPNLAHYASLQSPSDLYINPGVEGSLRKHFRDIRALWGAIAARDELLSTGVIASGTMIWFTSRGVILLGRLMNYYLDVAQSRSDVFLTTTYEMHHHYLVQEYLALAAIYLVKSLNFNPVVLGTPIFDARPSILTALHNALEEERRDLSHIFSRANASARLWALYVGVMAEQNSFDDHPSVVDGYFAAEFVKQTAIMQLYTWEETKVVLQGFLYNESIEPNGDLWYDVVTKTGQGTHGGLRVSQYEPFS